MAESRKPIKRSTELAPLSREHHEGLLFGWKLKQGLAKNRDAARMSAFVEWFWQTHLQAHFQKEEQGLPQVLAPSHPLLQQMFREHEEIKISIDEIRQHGDLKKLEQITQQLNDHIRFEERQLFPEVEKTATPEQLQQLLELWKEEPSTAIWEDEFWASAT